MQIGLGVIAGALLFSLLAVLGGSPPPPDDAAGAWAPWALVAIAAVMTAVGLIACGVPARRALRIQPTEALKESV